MSSEPQDAMLSSLPAPLLTVSGFQSSQSLKRRPEGSRVEESKWGYESTAEPGVGFICSYSRERERGAQKQERIV